MKHTLTLAALLVAAATSMAQKPVFRQPFAVAAGAKPGILTMPHHQDGRVAFMLKDTQKIEFLLLNQAFAAVAKFSHSQKPGATIYATRAVPIGCIYAGNKVYNFLYDAEGSSSKTTGDGRDAVLIDKLDFDAGSAELSLKHALPEGEKLANAFTCNNTLYLLSASPAGDAVSVCYIDSVLNKTVRTYPFNFAQLSGSMVRLEDALKNARVVQPGESGIDAYTAPVKIFPRADGFFIAFDYKTKNLLAGINLYENKLSLINPGYDAFTCDQSRQVYTTVADKNIFAVAACKAKLELGVFDLATGKLVKKYESAKDDAAPAFAVTMPASVTMSKGKTNGEKPLDNTGALAKEMLAANGGIKIVKNEAGQYITTITAFKNGSAVLPFPGISYAAEPAPGAITPFYSINYGYRVPIKTSYTAAGFKTILAPGSFDKIKQSLKPTAPEKLRDFFSLEENMPDAITLFTVNGAWHYAWYDAEAQQFTIRTVK